MLNRFHFDTFSLLDSFLFSPNSRETATQVHSLPPPFRCFFLGLAGPRAIFGNISFHPPGRFI